jgi:hypothetical protein
VAKFKYLGMTQTNMNPIHEEVKTNDEVFMAVWGGHHCLGYDAVLHADRFPLFQRSIVFIFLGLEVQGKCHGRTRRGSM